MTPNQLNRKTVADWLQGWDIDCTGRQLYRHTGGPPRKAFLRCVIELAWYCDDNGLRKEFWGASRAEATAKAAEWVRGQG